MPRKTDDFERRFKRCEEAIIQSGHFSQKEAFAAITHADPETKEQVAYWLRGELHLLRQAQKVPGRAPVLRGEALSRLLMADIAMTMLDACNAPPGDELTTLLEELLDLDRYRASAAAFPSDECEIAAELEAESELKGQKLGVRELARLIGVNPSTITLWRRHAEYRKLVEFHKRLLKRPSYQAMLQKLRDEPSSKK